MLKLVTQVLTWLSILFIKWNNMLSLSSFFKTFYFYGTDLEYPSLQNKRIIIMRTYHHTETRF